VVVCEVVQPSPCGFAEARHPNEDEIRRQLDGARERLQSLGDDLDVHAAFGHPAEELAFYGARSDLLIVGSRNFGQPGQLRHGRTTLQLGMLARCPLIVLPRPVTGSERPLASSQVQQR
jgi:nucleotide-binding universal stress UspA family protein